MYDRVWSQRFHHIQVRRDLTWSLIIHREQACVDDPVAELVDKSSRDSQHPARHCRIAVRQRRHIAIFKEITNDAYNKRIQACPLCVNLSRVYFYFSYVRTGGNCFSWSLIKIVKVLNKRLKEFDVKRMTSNDRFLYWMKNPLQHRTLSYILKKYNNNNNINSNNNNINYIIAKNVIYRNGKYKNE